jgi:hypothetical protein
MDGSLTTVEDIDFDFENSGVKVVVLRELPVPAMATAKVGQEIEMPYWTAKELVRDGYVKFNEKHVLDLAKIQKVHWRETDTATRKLIAIQPDFYCLLRRHLDELRQDTGKFRELDRYETLARDIVNIRVQKIITLSATPVSRETGNVLQNLASEERALYLALSRTIESWRAKLMPAAEAGK